MFGSVCVGRAAPFTPDTNMPDMDRAEKGTNKQRRDGGCGGGIAPEWDMTDSILTSHLAAGDVLVLTIHVLCPIIKPYFFFFDMT